MTIAISCLIFAAFNIILTKIPVAIAMNKVPGGYDNHNPRDQQAKLEGFGKRALAAHQNALEGFPVFAAGILLALWSNAAAETVNTLALVWVASRLIYNLCYWANAEKLRSLSWITGFVCSIWLMEILKTLEIAFAY